ncbi:hypothetical protein EW146_g7472 [Bondarzewia mesenterica]|uniref:Uncharacterized protein n=1 Tax=Bondarzewia mesenterica TaxID=1095465 RepID=A0A4S4LKN4_9AGAM|nr:hypothetical protein EW146_g7472 [Bondarzewia mesenterica]
MAQGPPPSAAGPSRPKKYTNAQKNTAISSAPPTSTFFQSPPQPLQNAPTQPYYNFPTTWQSQPWPVTSFPYTSPYQQPYAYQSHQFQQYHPPTTQPHHPPIPPPPPPPTKRPTPSPSPPPPELPRHWDAALKTFLSRVGLTQALRGFETDMLVLNPDWEANEVPPALTELRDNLSIGKHSMQRLLKCKSTSPSRSENAQSGQLPSPVKPLEERKLEYVHLGNDAEPRSQTSINKSISLLLARNRARNDASNRTEFLYAKKRARTDTSSESTETAPPSCARTDAKPVDRDIMMKFDVARNEEGPLRRTVKVAPQPVHADVDVLSDKHPGLDERLRNLEEHLAVRYVPSPPVSLLHRLKFLEDHIVSLEREHPPWAALHFNQPRRGWPPPPRPAPLIVPSHLTSSSSVPLAATAQTGGNNGSAIAAAVSELTKDSGADGNVKGKGKGRAAKSSLHRAVMERLEVQKAMDDLKGNGG